MVDLQDLIDARSGWILEQASAISNSGYITGYGARNGESHAFLLTPLSDVPEPRSWFTLTAGFMIRGLAWRRRGPLRATGHSM
jgi:hypothetical protein